MNTKTQFIFENEITNVVFFKEKEKAVLKHCKTIVEDCALKPINSMRYTRGIETTPFGSETYFIWCHP